MDGKLWIVAGSVFAALAVIAGSFGAHGLEGWLEGKFPGDFEKRLANWNTAATYQMYHSLGLILLGLIIGWSSPSRTLSAVGWLMVSGITLFSGMLYGWVLLDSRTMVMVVPVGGIGFIAGWVLLAIGTSLAAGDQSAKSSISSSQIDLG